MRPRFATVLAVVLATAATAAAAPEHPARALEVAALAADGVPREPCGADPAWAPCRQVLAPPTERESIAVGVSFGPGLGGSLGMMLRPDLEVLAAVRLGVVSFDDEPSRLYKSTGVGLRLWGARWLFVDGRVVLTNVTSVSSGVSHLGYEVSTGLELIHRRTFGLDVHVGITAVDGYVVRTGGLGVTFYQ